MALTRPFAQNGEKSPIPQTSQDGTVSYDQGFGVLYTLAPEEGGKYIDREQFNQILYDTTSAVIDNQNNINTLNDKIADIENSVSTGVVNLTGNQTINGTKTFRSPVIIPNGTANNHAVNLSQLNTKANQATTYSKTEVNNLLNAKANANATVNLTGAQTIQGVKTFSSIPVSATQPTNANQIANKAYVDSVGNAKVALSGNQNISGVKTFSVPPVSATQPTNANQIANKAYVDGRTSKYITQTYSNGASWYRVWSDKWCEQGSTIDTVNTTVTFLRPFKDTNYTLVGIGFVIANVGRQDVIKYVDKFVTFSDQRNAGTESWYACGYIA